MFFAASILSNRSSNIKSASFPAIYLAMQLTDLIGLINNKALILYFEAK